MKKEIIQWAYEKMTIYKFFTVAAFIMGIICSILIPVAQVPDEGAHMIMIGEELGLTDYVEETIKDYYEEAQVAGIMGNMEIKQKISPYIKSFSYRFSTEKGFVVPHLSVKLVRHLPAGLGFYLGIIIHLPVYFCLQLAELFSIIFYVIMGRAALKLMPVKKELFCAIMLLPMTIQQCSSVSYDSVLLPCSFLFLALVFYYKYEAKIVGWKELLNLIILLCVITIIKVPYILLALLIFLIPIEKIALFSIEKRDIIFKISKYKWILLAGVSIVILLTFLLLPESVFIKIIKASLLEFPTYLKILCKTVISEIPSYYVSMIGVLGWLDTPFSKIFYIFAGIILLLLSLAGKERLCRREKIIIILVTGSISLLIITAMISHSFLIMNFDINSSLEEYRKNMKTMEYIQGVQGRYFLPYVFLLFLVIDGIKNMKQKVIVVVQFIYYIVVFVNMIAVLLLRYWIQ